MKVWPASCDSNLACKVNILPSKARAFWYIYTRKTIPSLWMASYDASISTSPSRLCMPMRGCTVLPCERIVWNNLIWVFCGIFYCCMCSLFHGTLWQSQHQKRKRWLLKAILSSVNHLLCAHYRCCSYKGLVCAAYITSIMTNCRRIYWVRSMKMSCDCCSACTL